MRRLLLASFAALLVLGARTADAAQPACDKDTGISLPAGFCATVFADGLGTARHMVAAPDGTLYVALQAENRGGTIVALRDGKGSGHADQVRYFGKQGGSGIALHAGYLYVATPTSVLRYKLPV